MFKSMIMEAMILLSARVTAQEFSITGIVRDGKSNQVLTGATVQVESLSNVTVTDEFGRFRLEKLKAGAYTVSISFVGFQSKTEKVTLNADVNLSMTLEPSNQLTDEVVVYAT